jgi:hypothetical protein
MPAIPRKRYTLFLQCSYASTRGDPRSARSRSGLSVIFAPCRRWAPRSSSDPAAFDLAANLGQLPPNRCRPLLEDCRNVTALPNHCNDGDTARREGLVHDVVFANRIEEQCCATGELMAIAERSVILRDVLRALVQIIEVAVRQLLVPPCTRPRARLAQVSRCPSGQKVRPPAHAGSSLVLEIQNRLLGKPAVPQVPQFESALTRRAACVRKRTERDDLWMHTTDI